MQTPRHLAGIIGITVGLITLTACPADETTPCGDQVCRQGFSCDELHDLCVVPSQLEVCVGLPDGAECFVGGQTGYVCDQEVCIPSRCGDGIVDPNEGEVCDDGDSQNSNIEPDACRLDCQPATCGDGVTDTGEQCDDGNAVDTDDCHNNCTLSSCGDGMLDPGEECDGNALNNQTCDTRGYDGGQLACGADCHFDETSCTSQCGNSLVSPAEACDDGNLASGDGCSELCEVETGWECQGNPSICAPICGDGLVLGDQECDDGNTSSDDGCSDLCQVEPGWSCVGPAPTTCTSICGDGILVGTEQCDEGANNSDTMANACRTTCLNAFCGDGVMDSGEDCDGNDLGGQSCADLGYCPTLLLDCYSDCTYDISGCINPPEICNNLIDDNCDGDVDCYDSNCMFTSFCTGIAPGEICTDHFVDNDGDGQISCADRDCAARSCGDGCICTSYGTRRETNCADGVDNNSNGLIDCLDPDCDRNVACKSEDCSNGVDDNGNGLIDCLDSDCDYLPICGGEDCYNGSDDDGDGSPDCQDNDCRHLPHCAVWTISCAPLAPGSNCVVGAPSCLMGKCSEPDLLVARP